MLIINVMTYSDESVNKLTNMSIKITCHQNFIILSHPHPQVEKNVACQALSGFFLSRIELEKVDPRVNPNLLLEETSQAGSPEKKQNDINLWMVRC